MPKALQLLIGFIGFFSLCFWFFSYEEPTLSGAELRDALFVKTIPNAQSAKSRRNIWYSNDAENAGVGFDIRGSPKAFEALFPGYPDEMRTDWSLWESYFSGSFEADVYLATFSPASRKGFRAFISWTGCIDVFKKYGADLVVIGSSEVFRSIVPDELHRIMGVAQRPLKVLVCATGGMTDRAVYETAVEFLKTKNRPTAILWGYPLWSPAPPEARQAGQVDTMVAYRSKSNPRKIISAIINWRISSFFPLFSWDLFPAFVKKQQVENELARIPNGEIRIENLGLKTYKEKILNDSQALAGAVSESQLGEFKFFSDFQGCNDSDYLLNFKQTINLLRELAPRVYIFQTPVSPLQESSMPDCVKNLADNAIRLAAGIHGVHVWRGQNGGFGLDWSDFIQPTPREKSYIFDRNHVNFGAAMKVTKALANWMLTTK